jgi:general secretion pathway protein D
MAAILKPLLPADGLVRVDTVRNLLVLSGTRTQAEAWLDLVATFDVDLLKGMSVGVFPLKHATTKEIETALRLVSGGSGAGPSAGSTTASTVTAATQVMGGGVAAASGGSLTEGNPLFGALRIMPIERINSILVVTPRAAYLEEARRWIERLDQPNDSSTEPQLFIYQVKNVNARHLASVLSGIFGDSRQASGSNSGVAPGLTSATGGTTGAFGQSAASSVFGNTSSARTSNVFGNSNSGFGLSSNTGASRSSANAANTATQAPVAATLGSIRVMADELNNSVLVWSTRNEFSKIEATLKRLDLPLTQVLIEASIIEVTLGDGLEYGLQWAFSGDARSGYRGVGQISGLDKGLLGGVTQGFTYQLSNSAGALKAVLNGLASKSLIKVISSPNLMVLDNHTATINVGDQVPIVTSTTTFDSANVPTTSSVQYKDTGVNLVVTPSVNSGNVVTMQVDQTTTDVGTASASANNQPSFLQRQISSKVAVRSGESIVLGGLIKDNTTTSKSGVPFLQDVPVVGKLFGTNASKSNRTELLVIITPRVVRTDVDIREVSEDLRERMRGLQQIQGANTSRSEVAPVAPAGATRAVDAQ